MTQFVDEMEAAEAAARGSPFLTSKQAAHYLRLTERTMQGLRRRRVGPAYVRVGRQVRYHIRDLRAYVRTQDEADPDHA